MGVGSVDGANRRPRAGGGGEGALCGQNVFASWARVEPSPGTSTPGVTAGNTLPTTVTPRECWTRPPAESRVLTSAAPGCVPPHRCSRARRPTALCTLSHRGLPAFVLLPVIGRGHALGQQRGEQALPCVHVTPAGAAPSPKLHSSPEPCGPSGSRKRLPSP